MRTIEFRTLAGLTIEERGAIATATGSEMVLTGYAAKFNARSKNLGGFYEQIAPGAFTRSLGAGDDCKCLFNHDKNLILGRRDSGTLTVEEDATGLKFRCELNPASTQHRDIYEAVKRRDITECSFAFTINGDAGEDWKRISEKDDAGNEVVAVRTLKDLNLVDVSAVTYPAYNNTDVAARNITPEIRSALDTITKEIPTMSTELKKPEVRMDANDSYEDQMSEVWAGLRAAFPAKMDDGKETGYCKYWLVATFPTFVIVCTAVYTGDCEYFKITYTEGPEDVFKFGEPTPVEQGWVPSTRASKFVTEQRTALEAEQRSLQSKADDHKNAAADHQAMADGHKKEAEEHEKAAAAIQKEADAEKRCMESRGSCSEPECRCQNQMVDRADVWEDDDPEDRAAGQVRTKKVDGKNLTASKFAFVGDKDKTETWKLPIHDADHVRNALARLNQTEGIPADKKAGVARKIKAAAKKFGIDAASLDERSFPMDTDEVADVLNRAKAAMLVGVV